MPPPPLYDPLALPPPNSSPSPRTRTVETVRLTLPRFPRFIEIVFHSCAASLPPLVLVLPVCVLIWIRLAPLSPLRIWGFAKLVARCSFRWRISDQVKFIFDVTYSFLTVISALARYVEWSRHVDPVNTGNVDQRVIVQVLRSYSFLFRPLSSFECSCLRLHSGYWNSAAGSDHWSCRQELIS